MKRNIDNNYAFSWKPMGIRNLLPRDTTEWLENRYLASGIVTFVLIDSFMNLSPCLPVSLSPCLNTDSWCTLICHRYLFNVLYLFIYLFIFCSSQQGKIINPFPEEQKSPVCIYMTQEVQTEGCVLFTLG